MIRIESREQILQDHSRVWTEAPWRSPNSNRNFLLPSLNPLGLGAATTEAPHTCHGPAQVCRCSCPTPPALMPLMVPSPDPLQQGGTVGARPAHTCRARGAGGQAVFKCAHLGHNFTPVVLNCSSIGQADIVIICRHLYRPRPSFFITLFHFLLFTQTTFIIAR